MKANAVARAKGDAGFTLIELMVAVAIMGLVMTAILALFLVTQRSIFFATAGADAQEAARAVLDRLVAALRLINAGRPTPGGAITAASATSITSLADIDNDPIDASGNDATLAVTANAGATTVNVSSATGFSVGEILSIADGSTAETQSITNVSGP